MKVERTIDIAAPPERLYEVVMDPDRLEDWVTDVPLLVVATARPELLERRPNWGGGKLNATTLALAPLTNEEFLRLVRQLPRQPSLKEEIIKEVRRRGIGFPLTSGLRLVVVADMRAREAGRRFALIRGDETVHRVFEITRMSERLEFVEAPEAAA